MQTTVFPRSQWEAWVLVFLWKRGLVKVCDFNQEISRYLVNLSSQHFNQNLDKYSVILLP
jgi:hypothetical protein